MGAEIAGVPNISEGLSEISKKMMDLAAQLQALAAQSAEQVMSLGAAERSDRHAVTSLRPRKLVFKRSLVAPPQCYPSQTAFSKAPFQRMGKRRGFLLHPSASTMMARFPEAWDAAAPTLLRAKLSNARQLERLSWGKPRPGVLRLRWSSGDWRRCRYYPHWKGKRRQRFWRLISSVSARFSDEVVAGATDKAHASRMEAWWPRGLRRAHERWLDKALPWLRRSWWRGCVKKRGIRFSVLSKLGWLVWSGWLSRWPMKHRWSFFMFWAMDHSSKLLLPLLLGWASEQGSLQQY
ncbi:hypothetical protein OsI_28298 [Oryza sativa Indica Group]|uniref:Uncharacterized protein n=1 Tax=Oryza sativa subsp. indica TaxID=39946 RepID=A2YSJ7_ORYSI|nr:hypothetical protein OsI_28298 [Oryza sativa Indica Group]